MTQVQVIKEGVIGELVLNSSATLNALTHDDIKALSAGLAKHETDSEVRAIVIRSSSEKAFCAGGDMKHIRKLALQDNFDDIRQFFIDEYALNLAISRCTKPYIALMHGITMGGGLGVSVHGNFRIVTENSTLAMPESRIGFFPDVGASFFLPKLNEGAGLWLGLTAASVTGPEAVAIGLATHLVDSQELDELRSELQVALSSLNSTTKGTAHEAVKEVLEKYQHAPEHATLVDSKLASRKAWFADDDLAGIHERLTAAENSGDKDAAHLLHLLQTGSPNSATITVKLLRDTAGMSLEECLKHELELGGETVRHPDCVEGIRAVLVDKDRKSVWK